MIFRSIAQLVLFVLVTRIHDGSSMHRLREDPHLKIIGGRPAEIWEFPYQVSIEYLHTLNCGGSIITPNHILSAGHCFQDTTEEYILIRAGTSEMEIGGTVVKVKKINVHPKFEIIQVDDNEEYVIYDIAVLELEEALNFNKDIQNVKLPESNSTFTGSIATVTGWGVTESGLLSDRLLAVDVPIISIDECTKDYAQFEITSNQICTLAKDGGKDSCNGDSGGPLTVNGVQIGIVSYGKGCGIHNYPGVYTSVAAPEMREYIKIIAGV